MQPIYVYLSGLAAAFTLLHRLGSYAPIERAFIGAAGAGLGVYVVLVLGHAVVRFIAERPRPEEPAAESEGEEKKAAAEGAEAPPKEEQS